MAEAREPFEELADVLLEALGDAPVGTGVAALVLLLAKCAAYGNVPLAQVQASLHLQYEVGLRKLQFNTAMERAEQRRPEGGCVN